MADMVALKTLGIPADLSTVPSNLKLNRLGTPVWKLQICKHKNGYSVSIFWRNAPMSGAA